MATHAKNEPFRIAVNEQYSFDTLPEDATQLDAVSDGPGRFHILHEGRAFRAEVVQADYAARRYLLRVDGQPYTVQIADFYTRLVRQLGMATGAGHKTNTIKAPMPGLVLQVMVQPGQAVQKGDPLLILEAMKMENVIKAANEGTVKEVPAHSGQAVEKGATLVVLE
ncbi:MAG: biotin/lipoyl-containing protein [Saprospiraceae bacterium]|nr:biotin/lipoyl-binding protein [Saprospiraceae bacterium]MDW8230987.1 biotin/lipoyl-containing protein [Saprospiraceae bacterium]